MKPLISIIVPTYNSEKYLSQCIESLIDQTYKNIEIICVDDHSTDKTFEILQKYANKDSRIKLLRNEENKGTAFSRNKGLEAVTGKFLVWCDSDDWYEKNYCKTMLKTLIKSKSDIVVCNKNCIIEQDLNIYRKNFSNPNTYIENKKENITIQTFNNIDCFLWNKMFKTEIIKQYNILCPLIKKYEDWTFINCYLLLAKTICFIDKKLYNYRIHNNSCITKCFVENKGIMTYVTFDFLIALIDFMKKNNMKDKMYICNEIYYSNMVDLFPRLKGIVDSIMKDFLDFEYKKLDASGELKRTYYW